VLLLDPFDCYDTRDIQTAAELLKISLIYIPKGGTDQYELLDRPVLGALKAKDLLK
jgi:hypothetical protein